MKDLTIRELQTSLPWTVRYSRDFRTNPQSHKDFTHALLHVGKALGKLMGVADDMDHDRALADEKELGAATVPYIADLVVCALRAANTFPGSVLDLQAAVQDRIERKNGVKLAVDVGDGTDEDGTGGDKARAALEEVGLEFKRAYDSTDPRATDTLVDALNAELKDAVPFTLRVDEETGDDAALVTEVTKIVGLLEDDEWTDTYPNHRLAHRLEAQIHRLHNELNAAQALTGQILDMFIDGFGATDDHNAVRDAIKEHTRNPSTRTANRWIAALVQAGATQRLGIKDKDAIHAPNNFETAQRIVSNWPGWKKTFTLTPYSGDQNG